MKLNKSFILAVCLIGIFSSCSPNRKLLKEHDYDAVIRNSIESLSLDAKNVKAAETLTRTYSQASAYYQYVIDQILTGNDPLKWKKTLDIMGLQNEISEDILFNSSAVRLICDPKLYTSEMNLVKQRAVAELYEGGVALLNTQEPKKAKEAYKLLQETAKLESGYKEVGKKIQEAKGLATTKIVVEQVSAYSQYRNLLSKKFYQEMLNSLQVDFLKENFIMVYTPEEAKQRKLERPDLVVFVSFIDFQLGQFLGSQINTNGVIEVKVFSTIENKNILDIRIPAQYISQNYSKKRSDLQELFDAFSLSMCDEVVDRLSLFIRKYN